MNGLKDILQNREFLHILTAIESIITLISILDIIWINNYIFKNFSSIQQSEITLLIVNFVIKLGLGVPFSYFVFLLVKAYNEKYKK